MCCFVMWSPSTAGGGYNGMHGAVVFPQSLKADPKAPEHWPKQVGNAWEQAHKAVGTKSWDAATTMVGRALQAATRHLGAKPDKLAKEIDELGDTGILTKSMVEWAHEIRLLRNIGAHPDIIEEAVEEGDAKDIVEFLDYFLIYTYNLANQIKDYKARRKRKREGA